MIGDYFGSLPSVMEINRDLIADKVQTLSETELAVLLCLITEQHCIIETEKDSIDDLEQELRLVGVQRLA